MAQGSNSLRRTVIIETQKPTPSANVFNIMKKQITREELPLAILAHKYHKVKHSTMYEDRLMVTDSKETFSTENPLISSNAAFNLLEEWDAESASHRGFKISYEEFTYHVELFESWDRSLITYYASDKNRNVAICKALYFARTKTEVELI